MADLTVVIPARNEMFLGKTIENILENIEGDTEIFAVLDGFDTPIPEIPQDPRVKLIYHKTPIGQRASTNEATSLSTAKYVMKCDAHCAFDKGFDVKLMALCEPDWVVIPRMYNLHAFDWKCNKCGNRTYQGPTPTKCDKCDNKTDFERVILWQPRWNRMTDFARFDNTLHFKYWGSYKNRLEAKGDIADTMCFVGACRFMTRDLFWKLGGCDEKHGSWGQEGVEWSCKAWLSGGRLVVNKKTWFSHMFRTQGGDFGFPYKNPGKDMDAAREYSRDLWFNNKWEKAIHPLSWLLEKFDPIPDWNISRGILYYTDNELDSKIMDKCQKQLTLAANGKKITSVSLKGIDFGDNIVLGLKRSPITMFKQILAGLEAMNTDIVFLADHDVLYHPSHFDFIPREKDIFYYNMNNWQVRVSDGHAVYYDTKRLSMLCAYRELLIKHYKKRIELCEQKGFKSRMGFEPGTNNRPERVDDYKSDVWTSKYPNLDLKYDKNLIPARWKESDFRNKNNCRNWKETDNIPGWGDTKKII